VNNSVRDAVEGRLGLRAAGERQADAVVRGTITRYEPDVPLAYTGGTAGQANTVQVTKRMVQLTVNIEIVNQRTGAVLWQKSGLTVDGDYSPGQELDGRKKALDRLAANIVEGAQSQW
jgi:curli biogenesis system outer membrane secretion channel CsgG